MRLLVPVLLLIVTCTAVKVKNYEENEEIDEIDDAEATRVKTQFSKYFVCPYYIENPPPVKLSVRFSSEEVDLGNKMPAYVASIPPYISYQAEPGKLYCIMIFDCDTPYAGAPIYSQSLNALLVNIKGNNLAGCDYLTCFQPCVPYVGSGYHRYVILLFQQPKKIDITTPEMQKGIVEHLDSDIRYFLSRKIPLNRHKNLTNFSVKAFASQYDLGDAIAGNFFLTKTNVCNNEDYKPIVCSI